MEGYIKLNRSILETLLSETGNHLRIYIWLKSKESWQDKTLKIKTGKGERIVTIKKGQLLFGRHTAERETSIDGSTIYKIIQGFVKKGIINVESSNQFSIISMLDSVENELIENFEDFEILEEITPKEQPNSSEKAAKKHRNDNEIASIEQPNSSQITQTISLSLDNNNSIKKKKNKKEESLLFEMPAVLPWETEDFKIAWGRWKNFKLKTFKFEYKTSDSEQCALNDLRTLADCNEDTAIKIIDKSISSGWKGFFALKNIQNNETGKQTTQINGGNHGKSAGAISLLNRIRNDRGAANG